MNLDAKQLVPIVSDALGATAPVRIENLQRLTAGASRETWSLDAVDAVSETTRRGLILRFGTSTYGDVLGAIGKAEYEFYNTLSASSSLPLPKPVRYIADTSLLGSDFFLIDRIDHCETSPALLSSHAYREVAGKTVREVFRLGGELSRFAWQDTPLAKALPVVAPEQVWLQQLQYWRQVIADCAVEPQPTVNYLVNWLQANPPAPPERIVVLSGDFRLGNFLYAATGEVKGWLDWEMGHLGDPLEDLTWALMANWRTGDSFPGGLSRDDLIREWQQSSGLHIDAASLRWWTLFQHVKAQGIWQAAVRACATQPTVDMKHLMMAFSCPGLQDRLLMDDMRWTS